MFDSHDTLNIIYSARSNTCHPPFSPNIAPATEKKLSWLTRVTHETSFTLGGATLLTLQRHQKLCLPRRMTVIVDPHHIWKVIKLQRADQQKPPSNITKFCPCHEKFLSWFIRVKHATSCTLLGAPGLTPQHHQRFCPPRKITLQNVTEIYWKQLKRHLQCAADPRPFRPWSENDPTIIREWTPQSAIRSATEAYFLALAASFRAPAFIPNFTRYCACQENWRLTFTK